MGAGAPLLISIGAAAINNSDKKCDATTATSRRDAASVAFAARLVRRSALAFRRCRAMLHHRYTHPSRTACHYRVGNEPRSHDLFRKRLTPIC